MPSAVACLLAKAAGAIFKAPTLASCPAPAPGIAITPRLAACSPIVSTPNLMASPRL